MSFSLNNSKSCDYIDSIYHIELEIKNMTNIARHIRTLTCNLEIESKGRLRTKVYDKEMISIFLL